METPIILLDAAMNRYGSLMGLNRWYAQLAYEEYALLAQEYVKPHPVLPHEISTGRLANIGVVLTSVDLANPDNREFTVEGFNFNSIGTASNMRLFFNRQLRYILTESFEEYEAILLEIYAILLYHDYALWKPDSDVNIQQEWSLDEYRYYLKKQWARYGTDDILKILRKHWPKLKCFEEVSRDNFQIFQWVKIIGRLRQIIIHQRSKDTADEFCAKIATDLGINNKGTCQLSQKHKNAIFQYFDQPYGEPQIWLIDSTAIDEQDYKSIPNKLEKLMKILSDHASLVYRCAIEHFGSVPIWERKDSSPDSRNPAG